MTKFSSRAELLASGAREVTMEEMDWVSGGVTDGSDIAPIQGFQGSLPFISGQGVTVGTDGTITINSGVGGGPSFGGGFSFGADIPNFAGIGFLTDAQIHALNNIDLHALGVNISVTGDTFIDIAAFASALGVILGRRLISAQPEAY